MRLTTRLKHSCYQQWLKCFIGTSVVTKQLETAVFSRLVVNSPGLQALTHSYINERSCPDNFPTTILLPVSLYENASRQICCAMLLAGAICGDRLCLEIRNRNDIYCCEEQTLHQRPAERIMVRHVTSFHCSKSDSSPSLFSKQFCLYCLNHVS